MIAKGTFIVDIQPMDAFVQGKAGIQFYRMSISKTFHGDLLGTSQGEMLSAITNVQGSAGYVALEQVEGTIEGKHGTFVFQHYGLSRQEHQSLILEVVPDSGTGQLESITGKMTIIIVGGDHKYEFEYSLL